MANYNKLLIRLWLIGNNTWQDFVLSNVVCNHTRDQQIGLPLRGVRFCNHSYDYGPNWTPLSPITITNQGLSRGYQLQLLALADNPYLNFDYSGYQKHLIK